MAGRVSISLAIWPPVDDPLVQAIALVGDRSAMRVPDSTIFSWMAPAREATVSAISLPRR
jgi:hypothetical protein